VKKSKLTIGRQLPYFELTDQDGTMFRISDFAGKKNPVLFFLNGRTTFVIDKQGIIRRIDHAPFTSEKHIREAVQVLKQFIV
jgi:peroxiredoxin